MPRVAPVVSLNSTAKAALDQLVRSPSHPLHRVWRNGAGSFWQPLPAGQISKSLPNCRCRK